ncbi:MAG: hypothetical protein PHT07_15045 [Paludibacter sp.]|nr:hypothetical protein [Paludibacter sp.]
MKPEGKIDSDKILIGVLTRNSMQQWIVKGNGMKEYAVVGNPGRITNSQKYQLQKVSFTFDGHFAWLI